MPYVARPRMADPDTEKWYRAMARKSRITADVNYRRLRAFCEQMSVDPAGILQRARRQTAIRDLLDRFVAQEAEKKRAAWYIHSSVIAVKSWLRFNDRPLRLPVELPSNTVSPRREDERVPTREELRTVLLAAKPHERVVAVLMAHSGLRPGAIGSYLGDDGLRLKDLLDLHYAGDGCRPAKDELHTAGRIVFEKVPGRVRVRTTSSKAKHQYLTFLGEEGCGYLAQYLEQRVAQGEVIGPESSVAHPRYSDKEFVRALNISAKVRRLFRSAGLVDAAGRTPRPYVLRQYFLNRCLEAQSRTGVPDRFVEYWAGHRGDVTAQYYTTGLPHLPDTLVEEMRTAYK
ncbi:MAG: site-specific integrase, partial [Thermoplasmata archaeon]